MNCPSPGFIARLVIRGGTDIKSLINTAFRSVTIGSRVTHGEDWEGAGRQVTFGFDFLFGCELVQWRVINNQSKDQLIWSLRYEMLVVVKSESAGLKSGVEKSVYSLLETVSFCCRLCCPLVVGHLMCYTTRKLPNFCLVFGIRYLLYRFFYLDFCLVWHIIAGSKQTRWVCRDPICEKPRKRVDLQHWSHPKGQEPTNGMPTLFRLQPNAIRKWG